LPKKGRRRKVKRRKGEKEKRRKGEKEKRRGLETKNAPLAMKPGGFR
jgi:hypothetical protein